MKKLKPLNFILSLIIILSLFAGTAKKTYAKVNDGNNTFDLAEAIDTNTAVSGFIGSESDKDYYKFTLPAAGNVTTLFTHDYIDEEDSTLWKIDIFDSSKRLLQTLQSNAEDIKASNSVGLPAGTYYVCVSPKDPYDDYIDTQYNLTIGFKQSDYYEKEINNTQSLANKIMLNSTYTGSLHNYSDNDYYYFDCSSAGNLDIQFKHKYIDSDEIYLWKIELTDESGKNYLSFDLEPSKLTTKAFVGLPKGRYYLHIYNGIYSEECENVPYEFKTTFTKGNYYEKEFNNTFELSNKIALNKTYTAGLSSESDKDVFNFTLKKKKKTTISIKHQIISFSDDEDPWCIDFYSKSGKLIKSYFSFGNKSKRTYTSTLNKGKYYIKISSCGALGDDSIGVKYMLKVN